MAPEEFYKQSNWPEMKDAIDKVYNKFSHYDLCQFGHDYAKQELSAYKERLKGKLMSMKCKWNGNRDACANETCWDLNECQGSDFGFIIELIDTL